MRRYYLFIVFAFPRLSNLVRNQLPSSLRQPHSALCLWLACSWSYHIFALCQLATRTTHNSHSIQLPAQNLPFSQIFPTIRSLPVSGMTPRTVSLRLAVYLFACSFYSAPQWLHCKRCTSHSNSVCLSVRPFVRLSVTRRYCAKTTARSTVQLHCCIAKSDILMCLVL